jgi:hypothetical protein
MSWRLLPLNTYNQSNFEFLQGITFALLLTSAKEQDVLQLYHGKRFSEE